MEVPSARQIIAARGLLGISQQTLAEGSGVSIAALKRFEAKADQSEDKANTRVGTISKLMVYLNGRGIAFLSHDDFKGVVKKKVTIFIVLNQNFDGIKGWTVYTRTKRAQKIRN